MARPHIDPWLVKGPKNIRMAPWLNAFLVERVSHQLKLGEKTSQDKIIENAILAQYGAEWRDSWIKTKR